MLTTTDVFPDNSTNAHFRAWGQAIANGLTAAGLSKTSDAGQINWATVTAPGANTYAGYEVWHFTDTLQSTVPVIFRIDYGDNGGFPSIMFQASDTSDGAGNLVGGQLSHQWVLNLGNGSASTLSRISVSGSTNRMAIGFCITNRTTIGHNPQTFTIERDHDNTGADTNLGFVMMSGNGDAGVQFIPKASNGLPIAKGASMYIANLISGAWGTNLGVFPMFSQMGWVLNPSANLFCQHNGDIPENTLITFSVYGANHDFMTVAGDVGGSQPPVLRYD